MTELKLVPLI